jgi:hypothetical protein
LQAPLSSRTGLLKQKKKKKKKKTQHVGVLLKIIKNRFLRGIKSINQTMQAMDDFHVAQGRREPTMHLGDPQPVLGWKAPEVGWFKANWDAAVGEKSGRTGLGVVIRNSHGTTRIHFEGDADIK